MTDATYVGREGALKWRSDMFDVVEGPPQRGAGGGPDRLVLEHVCSLEHEDLAEQVGVLMAGPHERDDLPTASSL